MIDRTDIRPGPHPLCATHGSVFRFAPACPSAARHALPTTQVQAVGLLPARHEGEKGSFACLTVSLSSRP